MEHDYIATGKFNKNSGVSRSSNFNGRFSVNVVTIVGKNNKNMINWNAENTYYFALIITSLLLIVIYFLFLSKR